MAATATDNAEAAADVQNVLAELKAGTASTKKYEGKEESTVVEKDSTPVEKTTTEENKPDSKEDSEPAPGKDSGEASKVTTTDGNKAAQDKERPGEKREHSGKDHRNTRGGYRGRGGRGRGGRIGNKADYSQLPDSDDHDEIRKQVEFYFSDSNLPQDAFLMSQNEGRKNTPVDIALLSTFKRMRRFKPREAVIEALKGSHFLDVVYEEDRPKVKRKVPLTEDANGAEGKGTDIVKVFEDRAMPRSIYAKGFGEELPTTQFDIENFFTQFGPTNAIRLRRADDKTFKRSVFVEFDSEDTAKQFLALDPKPKYNGNELLILSKKAYVEGKAADIASGRIKPRPTRYDTHKRKRGDEEDTRDWRTRREEDRRSGFRNDKKRGGHSNRGEREHRGGRDDKKENGAEKDQETIDALAKAKAAVEEQEKVGKENQSPTESKKRAREDDEEVDERPEKKTNTNFEDDPDGGKAEEMNGDSGSKKRAREDDAEEEAPAPKKPAVETAAS